MTFHKKLFDGKIVAAVAAATLLTFATGGASPRAAKPGKIVRSADGTMYRCTWEKTGIMKRTKRGTTYEKKHKKCVKI